MPRANGDPVMADGGRARPDHGANPLRMRGFALAAASALVAVASFVVGPRDARAIVTGAAAVAIGANHLGQLGNGTATDSSTDLQVTGVTPGGTGAVAIAEGQLFSLALRPDTSVAAWGSNRQGELGDGTEVDRYVPVSVSAVGGNGSLLGVGCPVSAPSSCNPLAAGNAHSLSLKPDGTVLAWGNNDFGQLGDGTTLTRQTPVQIMGPGSGIVSIAAGGFHSLALKSDGTVLAWGGNYNGQLGNGSTSTTFDANPNPATVTGLTGVTAISAGSLHSLALKSDGTVRAWGQNTFGQLGLGYTPNPPNPPNPNTTDSSTPQTVVGADGTGSLSGVSAISSGGLFNVALKSGGVVAWGSDFNGELGNPANFSTTYFSSTPLTVVDVGGSGSLSGVTAVAAARGVHVLAIRADGTVVSWGQNNHGQLGNGTTTDSDSPVVVTGVAGAIAVAGGDTHSTILQAASGPTATGPPAPTPYAAPAPLSVPTPVASSSATPPQNVAATDGTIATFNTPVLAADPIRPGHLAIAYGDGNSSACYLSLSVNGGRSWSKTTLIGPGGTFPMPSSTTDPTPAFHPFGACYGENVAYAPDGTLYYLFNGTDPNGSYYNLFLTTSADGTAAGFRSPSQLDTDAPPKSDPTRGNGDSLCCPLASAVDMAFDQTSGPSHGELYVGFKAGPNGTPVGYMARLTSCTPTQLATFVGGGALACNPSVRVNPSTDVSITVNAAPPTVGPDGTVYVAWLGQKAIVTADVSNPQSIEMASSPDHGQTFGTPSVFDLTDNLCPNGSCLYSGAISGFNLAIASGTAQGQLYAAVSTRRDGFGRIAVSVSSDGGANWASRKEIGQISGAGTHQQHTPRISVAPNGRLDVGYYDTGPDGSENAYVTSSSDGGATYSAPLKLSSIGSQESILSQGFPAADAVFGGASTNAGYQAAWADSRRESGNGKTDIEFASTIAPAAVLPAMSNRAYGGYVTASTIQNTGSAPANAFIVYFDQSGLPVGPGDAITNLPVNGNWTVRQDNGHGFPGTGGDAVQAGSAVVFSDQPIASFVNEFGPGNVGDATSYTGVPVPAGVASTLYAPTIVNNAYGGYTTGIGLLNQGSSPTNVTISYRDGSGALVATQTVAALAPNAYQALYSGAGSLGLPSGFAGTATITGSAGQPLGAVVNETGPGGQFSSYDAVAVGNTVLNVPAALNNAFGGYFTGTGIQNTSGVSGTVSVTYYDSTGTATPKSFSITPNGYLGIYQGSSTDGPAPGAYTAVIQSTVPVAAIVNEVAPSSGPAQQSTAYNTLPTGGATIHLPLVENAGSDPWNTGEGIMNTGSGTTTVTVSYFDSLTGSPVGTPQTRTLAPRAFWGLYQPIPGGLPSGGRATAVVTTSFEGLIAVICNESSPSTFMSYDGL